MIDTCKAVKQDAEAPISVLDQRACTFLKLGDFDKASSDAAAVIRRDRRDATVIILEFRADPQLTSPGLSKTWPDTANTAQAGEGSPSI